MASLSSINDITKGIIVKGLASKSYTDVGLEFELDKIWPNIQTMRMNVYKMYNLVKNSTEQERLEKYGVTNDALEMVEKALADRKLSTNAYGTKKDLAKKESQDLLLESDIKSLATSGRDKSAILIHKKMDQLSMKPKMLEKESIVNLAKVFATFFDKAQIATGQATEHIAVHAKIGDNISPEDAMEMLLRMRDNTMAEKEKVKQSI